MNSKTLRLRDTLKRVLKEAAGVEAYADEAPEEAEYPYIVFQEKVLTAGVPTLHALEVNVWDEYGTHSRVDTVMDLVEQEINQTEIETNDIAIWIYSGQRDHPLDENKKIKRCREQFTMKAVGRS